MTSYFLDLLQTALDGVLFGSTYALVAVGFTVVWGLLWILNLAHGETVMIGMFAGMVSVRFLHLPQPLAFIAAMLAACVVGFAVERICYRPLRRQHKLVPMIATLAFWIFLEEVFTKIYFKVWFRDIWSSPTHSTESDSTSGRCGSA